MNNLINLFKYSSDNVILTDYDFNILWSNNKNDFFKIYGDNCSQIFQNEMLPLTSGVYCFSRNNLIFECKVINYPECENGIYVIEASGEDIMFSNVKCQSIREFYNNQAGLMRTAITGINASIELLRYELCEAELYESLNYLNSSYENCCKLLNLPTLLMELINYANDDLDIESVDLSSALETFVQKSSNVLKDKLTLEKEIAQDLYIKADYNRLIVFLISMVILAAGEEYQNNIIKITADDSEEYISVLFTPVNSDTNNAENKHSKHINLYNNENKINLHLTIAERFCKTFNGTLFTTCDKNNQLTYGVKLPHLERHTLTFHSNTLEYSAGNYSRYHVLYSDLL